MILSWRSGSRQVVFIKFDAIVGLGVRLGKRYFIYLAFIQKNYQSLRAIPDEPRLVVSALQYSSQLYQALDPLPPRIKRRHICRRSILKHRRPLLEERLNPLFATRLAGIIDRQ